MSTSQVLGYHDEMAPTKTNTQNSTKHAEHQDATDIKKQNYWFEFKITFKLRYQLDILLVDISL